MTADQQAPWVRSALFVPAQRREFLAKIDSSGADAVILDLEDAVADPAKQAARANAREWLDARSPGRAPLAMARVNALEVGAIEHDLDAVTHPALVAVLLPKVRSADEIVEVAELLSWYEGRGGLPQGAIRIWPIIETAKAVQNAHAIATASTRVEFMGGGTAQQGDLARDIGFEWTADGLETLYIRSRVLLAARAAGLRNPMTGLVSGLSDLDSVRSFALSSRQLGYAGMMVIHPVHVAAVNDIFTPSADRVDDARRIIETLDTAAVSGVGAVRHDGRMVDVAMGRTAEQLVADAERLGAARPTDVSEPE